MEGVDLEAVGSQEADPVTVAGMVLDPASGPGDACDVALGAQQPVTGDPTFIRYAQGDRHAVGQEHQSARGRRSRAASASQTAGSHHGAAPYSLTTRSNMPLRSGTWPASASTNGKNKLWRC